MIMMVAGDKDSSHMVPILERRMSELSAEINIKDLILHLAGVSGELSQTALERLPCTDSYREKCLYLLKKEDLNLQLEILLKLKLHQKILEEFQLKQQSKLLCKK